MSHPSHWCCLACGAVIGQHDAAGRLRPVPPAETLPVTEIAANGAAVLRCQKCGEVRLRKPGAARLLRTGGEPHSAASAPAPRFGPAEPPRPSAAP